jgi:hypothetical protein
MLLAWATPLQFRWLQDALAPVGIDSRPVVAPSPVRTAGLRRKLCKLVGGANGCPSEHGRGIWSVAASASPPAPHRPSSQPTGTVLYNRCYNGEKPQPPSGFVTPNVANGGGTAPGPVSALPLWDDTEDGGYRPLCDRMNCPCEASGEPRRS